MKGTLSAYTSYRGCAIAMESNNLVFTCDIQLLCSNSKGSACQCIDMKFVVVNLTLMYIIIMP